MIQYTRKNSATMKMVVLVCALLSFLGVVEARKTIQYQLKAANEDAYDTVTERKFDYTQAFL